MATFRILYLRNSVLVDSDVVEAPDIMPVVERTLGCPPDVVAEIWSDRGRVGLIGPSLGSNSSDLAANAR